MRAFGPFSHTDMNSFHNINEALLVLLAKTEEASTVRSYRPISPIHSVGKLFAKVLACKLPVILRHWCTKARVLSLRVGTSMIISNWCILLVAGLLLSSSERMASGVGAIF
jgi:hypothetical protein